MTYPVDAINRAFALLPQKMDSRQARIVHAAIGFQESGFLARRQIITVTRDGKKVNVPEGPAMGFWQFESGGGVKGVMTHPSVSSLARQACHACGVPFVQDAIWKALEVDDVLAAALARLLMWTDASPLPKNQDEAWAMYARTWRPGKPHPDKWAASYTSAIKSVCA
jgi:hypothetical protein